VSAFLICGLLQLVHTRTADGFMSRYRVQVQNAVARLITGVRRCEHITPALHQLHWLPVRRQVNFKISTLISFLGTTRVYLPAGYAAGRHPLRSADNRTCSVKRSRNQFSDSCFATARPTLWNSLPEHLQEPDITFRQFKKLLKTFMFG